MEPSRTTALKPGREGPGCLSWLDASGSPQLLTPLTDTVSLGYSRGEVRLDSPYVSSHHGTLCRMGDQMWYRDESRNGTWVHDRLMHTRQPVLLKDGDILRIGNMAQPEDPGNVVLLYTTGGSGTSRWERFVPAPDTECFLAGREAAGEEDLKLEDPTVSRSQCLIRRTPAGWAAENRSRTNPTALNGAPLQGSTCLYPQDVLRMGDQYLLYDGRAFFVLTGEPAQQPEPEDSVPADHTPDSRSSGEETSSSPEKEAGAASSDATKPKRKDTDRANTDKTDSGRKKSTSGPGGIREVHRKAASDGAGQKTLEIHITRRSVRRRLIRTDLLRDIHLTIRTGELVLILGGSGAGKTTFLHAVMGYEPAEGRILFGGRDIYRNYRDMKYEIGYVPQEDLVRKGDTVLETVRNAAELKLPQDLSVEVQEQKVRETLVAFGLEREQNHMVSKLSGGQRKRLSIAVEYIGQPSLFFLDEPDSGLDGIMARSLMDNLRFIADTGKVVLVITHAPDRAFDLFDKVLVLAKSSVDNCGRLAFFGTPEDALDWFGVESLEQVIRRINRKDEGGDGLADRYIQAWAASEAEEKGDE